MAHIPPDISREIFLRLPPKSLIRFRAVCTPWRSVIDDPCFVKAHADKQQSSNSTILIRNSTGSPFYPLYSVDLETLNFANGFQSISATPLNFTRSGLSRLSELPVATCNGLMLIPPEKSGQNWEIWNTLTHERLELPRRNFDWRAVGLGYVCASDDYKAVAIVHQKSNVYRAHVYSLKWDSWRKIKDFRCANWPFYRSNGVFLSGALHWIAWYKIVVLGLGTESRRELILPPLHKREQNRVEMLYRKFQLDALGGCLVVSDFGYDDIMLSHFDVWVMKDYGVGDSWTKLFYLWQGHQGPGPDDILRPSLSLRPVAYMNNKMHVFLQDDKGFYLFDVESDSAKKVNIHGLCGDLTAQVFHGTIFRLHHNCGVRRSRRTRKMTSKSKGKGKGKVTTDTKAFLHFTF